MHCPCCGPSSWRPNGWRFPAASWTISAGTAAPRAARVPFPPVLVSSQAPRPPGLPPAHILGLAFGSRRCSPFLVDPSSTTPPLFRPQPPSLSQSLLPFLAEHRNFLIFLVPQLFCFSAREAASPKSGSLGFFGCPHPSHCFFGVSDLYRPFSSLLPPSHSPVLFKDPNVLSV